MEFSRAFALPFLELVFPSAKSEGMASQASAPRKQGFWMEGYKLNAFTLKVFSGFLIKCSVIVEDGPTFKGYERTCQATLLGV